MLKRHYQTQFVQTKALSIDLQDAQVSYLESFLDYDTAWQYFDLLKADISWRQETITLYGKEHPIPRLWCWMADKGLDYSYSNKTMSPVDWSEDVLLIKSKVESITQHQFNSVLINHYRDGQDSNGWHADNEPELGSNPVIASVSLGATRDFHLRHNQDNNQKHSIALQHGSLLVMQGKTQTHWKHQVPKRAHADPRINLTFRKIKHTDND